MKKLVLFCLLGLAVNTFAFECVQQEAQFIGNVSSLYIYQDDYAQIGQCHFKLNIMRDNYRPSMVPGCALDYNEVLNTTFSYDYFRIPGLSTCPVRSEGQEISGYLVKKNGKIIIE